MCKTVLQVFCWLKETDFLWLPVKNRIGINDVPLIEINFELSATLLARFWKREWLKQRLQVVTLKTIF